MRYVIAILGIIVVAIVMAAFLHRAVSVISPSPRRVRGSSQAGMARLPGGSGAGMLLGVAYWPLIAPLSASWATSAQRSQNPGASAPKSYSGIGSDGSSGNGS